MKVFTDPSGKFQILTPIDTQYKNPGFDRSEREPHAFGKYEGIVGAFQISCKLVTPHIATLISDNQLRIQKGGPFVIEFFEKFVEVSGTHTFIWMAAVEDHFFFATYIHSSKAKKKVEKELAEVREMLTNVRYILPEHRERKLAERRLNLFMYATAALIDLRNKALENGSFIELVVLTANRIDALLRLSIILTNQLEKGNDEIDTSLLFQGEQDRPIMERTIYQKALSRNIITQSLFDELELLYLERNKVVHRYIITDIRTEEVIKIVFRYYELEDKIDVIINSLENEQFQKKIGMNADVEPGKLSDTQLEVLKASVRDKHGRIDWKASEEKGK